MTLSDDGAYWTRHTVREEFGAGDGGRTTPHVQTDSLKFESERAVKFQRRAQTSAYFPIKLDFNHGRNIAELLHYLAGAGNDSRARDTDLGGKGKSNTKHAVLQFGLTCCRGIRETRTSEFASVCFVTKACRER